MGYRPEGWGGGGGGFCNGGKGVEAKLREKGVLTMTADEIRKRYFRRIPGMLKKWKLRVGRGGSNMAATG